MSDEEKKQKRPNANYGLSRQKVNEEEITYHYNRERRLEKAPQAVRDLYKDEKPARFNLLRPLMNTKGKTTLFLSIVIMSIFIIMLNIMGYIGSNNELEGNLIEAEAFKYDGAVLVVIKKTITKNRLGKTSHAYTGNVNIVVSDSKADYPVKIAFNPQPVQSFEFTVPFDSDELSLYLQTESNNLKLKINPE